MKTLAINNEIKLVKSSDAIEVKVICPEKFIQNMLNVTEGRFISKTFVQLNYNHHAGRVYEVIINARYENVEKFLKGNDLYMYRDFINYNEYISLLKDVNYNSTILQNKIASLYAFETNLSRIRYTSVERAGYTRYYRADGHSILRPNTDFTENGTKRYIKTGKGWLSNKKY